MAQAGPVQRPERCPFPGDMRKWPNPMATSAFDPSRKWSSLLLFGKSVIVTWTESRSQRHVGEAEFYNVTASHKLSIYVSTQGRVFSRQINQVNRVGSGKSDQVAGQRNGPEAVRTPSFSGQTMTIVAASQGGARRMIVNFDAGFSSCSSSGGTGFEAGKTRIAFSPITKKNVEMRSVSTSNGSCTVQSGNVLGSES